MQDFITANVDVRLHHLRCDCVRVSSVQGQEHVCMHAPHCPGGAEVRGNRLADIWHHIQTSLSAWWNKLDPSLHIAHIIARANGRVTLACIYCNEVDHRSEDRALYLFLFITILLKFSGVLLTVYCFEKNEVALENLNENINSSMHKACVWIIISSYFVEIRSRAGQWSGQ